MAKAKKRNKIKKPTDTDALLVNEVTKATALREDVRKADDPVLQSRADELLRKSGDAYLRAHSPGYARELERRAAEARLPRAV